MDLLDLIWPKMCVQCGAWGRYICKKCEVGVWTEELICPECARKSLAGSVHLGCKNKSGMEGLVSIFAYEGLTKRGIQIGKYKYKYKMFDCLFDLGREEMQSQPYFELWRRYLKERPWVVPVPLHAEREKRRGFNQAKHLALLLSKSENLEVKDVLLRTVDTPQQVGKSRSERMNAMKGVFECKTKLVGESVVLVDDVWTTGATMRECARVLRNSGAKRVWGFVLAR